MAKKRGESCISILFKMTILMTIMLAIIVTAIFFGYQKLTEFFNRGGNILVPDFRGMHIVEVFKAKPDAIDIVRRDEKFDAYHERDHVIAQYPEPGTVVRPGKKILLSISLGMQTVNVPDLTGSGMREVDLALLNSNLVVGNRSYMHSKSVPHDRVMNQSPLPSEEYGLNQDVDLLISLGSVPESHPLPNLSGLNLDEAKKRLKAWGFNFGRIFSKTATGRPKFQVISTNPAPYTSVRKGAVVSLLISAGEDNGTATEVDLQRFELSGSGPARTILPDPVAPEQHSLAPPRIVIADDARLPFNPIPTPQQNRQTIQRTEREVSFMMPDGFMPKEVKFIHITPDGRNQVYEGTHKPLELIKVNVPALHGSRVQIYINDVPIEEVRIEESR